MKSIATISLCIFLGCAGASQQVAEPDSTGTGEASYQQVLAATDIDGKAVGAPGADVRATLVVFFASWCGPCRHELGILGELRNEHPDLRVVGINAYEEWSDMSDEQRLREFLGENAPWLQVVRGNTAMMKSFGGVPKIPTMFVFDADGRLAHTFRRGKEPLPDKQQIARAIDAARGGPQARR